MFDLMEKFEQFCLSKPADETYDYQNPTECPCAQFAKSVGMEQEYYGTSGKEKFIIDPEQGYAFVEAEIYAATKPHNFGALADRIKKRVHDQPGGAFNRQPELVEA
jgi:hypothetical protein